MYTIMRSALQAAVGKRLPAAGMARTPVAAVQRTANGMVACTVQVFVAPFVGGTGRSKQHRVMCLCPGCNFVGSAGRLHQHVCK